MRPTTAAEAVVNGAQLLDERYPGWYDKIDLDELDIDSSCKCICGQLGEYEQMFWVGFAKGLLDAPTTVADYTFDEFAYDHGFLAMSEETTREWKELILDRREMNAAPPIVEQQEEVYA